MVCQKCNAQNLDDAKFCESCGAKLEAPKPAGGFCTSCGKQIKPGARFCGSCGAPQGDAPAARPAPAPAPVPAPAPAPAPMPMPSQAPMANPLYHGGPQPNAGTYGPVQGTRKKSACGTTCIVLLVILAALGFGGYYFGKKFILSRPEALIGTWKSVEGKNDYAGDEFAFELAKEGEVKLVRADGKPMPIDIVFKPKGNQEFTSRIQNPANKSQYADFTINLKSFTELDIKIARSDGTKETVSAKRK